MSLTLSPLVVGHPNPDRPVVLGNAARGDELHRGSSRHTQLVPAARGVLLL